MDITVATLVEEQMSSWKGNLPKLPIESNIVRLATTSIGIPTGVVTPNRLFALFAFTHMQSNYDFIDLEIVALAEMELEEPEFELIEWKTGRMGHFCIRTPKITTSGLQDLRLIRRGYNGGKDLAMQGGNVGEGLCGGFLAAGNNNLEEVQDLDLCPSNVIEDLLSCLEVKEVHHQGACLQS
ncbi:hypothetical protein Tco_0551898 [Tanacetum coccineum]